MMRNIDCRLSIIREKAIALLRCIVCGFFVLSVVMMASEAADRIELDYKYTTDSISEFYLLSHFLEDHPEIVLDDETYEITKSPNEFFVDYYFDTIDYYLLQEQNSLRLRYRFVNGRLGKRLMQFKVPVTQMQESKFEYKLKIDSDTLFNSPNDVVEFLQLPQNTDKEFVRILSPVVNITSLKKVMELYQIRTRYYFTDKNGKPYFTVTFDESFAHRGMTYEPFHEVEFEINEKRMGKSNEKEGARLIKQIQDLINEAKSTSVKLYPIRRSKYARALEHFGIQSRNARAEPPLMFIVVGFIAVFFIFWVVKRYRQKGSIF